MAMLFPGVALSAPACVVPEAKSIVIASSPSDLADGHSAQWRLESIDGARQVLLMPCSGRNGNRCYFAIDVEPGRYYFKEVVPGAYNRMQYPVSTPQHWFEIGGKGVDYIGNWIIQRANRRTDVSLRVDYDSKGIDKMIALCQLENRRLFLGRTNAPSVEVAGH